jgi:hypothetical protein
MMISNFREFPNLGTTVAINTIGQHLVHINPAYLIEKKGDNIICQPEIGCLGSNKESK